MTDGSTPAGAVRRPGFLSVLRLGEFRAMFVAHLLSLVGDQVAKVALAVLVFDRTSSPALAATTYALTFLPWLIGAPTLAGLGDRFPRRTVLIVCDVLRAAVVGLMAVPGMPIVVLLGLLAVVSLLAPPFESARAALLADVLVGDEYVLASALTNMSLQGGQAVGFALGGVATAAVGPRGALAFDAATFVLSGILLATRVRRRALPAVEPANVDGLDEAVTGGAEAPSERAAYRGLDGLRYVLREPLLRSLALLAWLASFFSIVPEGLAVPIVRATGGSSQEAGLLTAAGPIGALVGGAMLARLVHADRRARLLQPLALLSVAPLALSALAPGHGAVFALWLVAGLGASYNLAAAAIFIQAVPAHLRARAFAVVQAGLQVLQGIGLLTAGAIADRIAPLTVVSWSGVAGILAVLLLWRAWPSDEASAKATRQRKQHNL